MSVFNIKLTGGEVSFRAENIDNLIRVLIDNYNIERVEIASHSTGVFVCVRLSDLHFTSPEFIVFKGNQLAGEDDFLDNGFSLPIVYRNRYLSGIRASDFERVDETT